MPETLIAPKGLTFVEDTHRYYYDNQRVPNVTSLLSEYGLTDFSMVPEARLEYKRVLGIAVHLATHLLDERRLDEDSLDIRIRPFVDAYRKFREVTGFDPRHSELKLFSRVWRFAGTLDRQGLFEWKGKEIEAILDLKCTWSLYPSNGPQTAAYQLLFEENHPERIRGRFCVQLKETGNYEVLQYADPSDKNVFLSCIALHQFKEKHKLLNKEEWHGNDRRE